MIFSIINSRILNKHIIANVTNNDIRHKAILSTNTTNNFNRRMPESATSIPVHKHYEFYNLHVTFQKALTVISTSVNNKGHCQYLNILSIRSKNKTKQNCTKNQMGKWVTTGRQSIMSNTVLTL